MSFLLNPFAFAVAAFPYSAIYALDEFSNQVFRFDLDTFSKAAFAGSGSSGLPVNGVATASPMKFATFSSVEQMDDGDVLITESFGFAVSVSPAGILTKLLGPVGTGAVYENNLLGIVFDMAEDPTTGIIYFGTDGGANGLGGLFALDGGVLTLLASSPATYSAGSVVQDPHRVVYYDGALYMSTQRADVVQKYQIATGVFSIVAGVPNTVGTQPGRLRDPLGVTVMPVGSPYAGIHICDYGNNRVQYWPFGATAGTTTFNTDGASPGPGFRPTAILFGPSGDGTRYICSREGGFYRIPPGSTNTWDVYYPVHSGYENGVWTITYGF